MVGQTSIFPATTVAEAFDIAARKGPMLTLVATYASDVAEIVNLAKKARDQRDACIIVLFQKSMSNQLNMNEIRTGRETFSLSAKTIN